MKDEVNEAASMTGRVVSTLFAIAAVVPPLMVLLAIWRFGINLPFDDDWDALSVVTRFREGLFSLEDLWIPHSEHRVLAVRLVILPLGLLTNASVVAQMITGVGLTVLTLVCVRRLIRQSVGSREPHLVAVLTFLVSLVLFWGTQHELWLWGFVSVVWSLTNLAVVCTVLAFTLWPGRWTGFALALLSTLVGTFSLASGLGLWVIGGLAIALGPTHWAAKRWQWLALWCVLAALVILTYYSGLTEAGRSVSGARYFLGHLSDFALFIFIVLGSILGGGPFTSAVVGAAGILALIGVSWFLKMRGEPLPSIAPWLFLAAYGLLSSVLIAIGRLQAGLAAASVPRYVTGCVLLWVALVVLTGMAWGSPGMTGTRRLRREVAAALLIVIMTGGYAVSYVNAYPAMEQTSRNLEFALAGLYSEGGPSRDVLLYLYSIGVEDAKARVDRFRRLQFGPFAPSMRAQGARLAAELRPATQIRDAVGTYEAAGCNVAISGWAWDRTQPDRPVRVDIFDGSQRLDTVTAGWFEWHLRAAGIGNGRHVFRYITPDTLKDGRLHVVTARVAGNASELQSKRIAFACKGTK